MRFFITCDSFWEAQVDKVINCIDDTGYEGYFSEQDYGNSLNGITVVLMCQDPNLNLKQRIRFSKKEKNLYLDIMLNLPHFLEILQKEREEIIVDKIITEVPQVIAKYKFKDFELVRFEKDLKKWMREIL